MAFDRSMLDEAHYRQGNAVYKDLGSPDDQHLICLAVSGDRAKEIARALNSKGAAKWANEAKKALQAAHDTLVMNNLTHKRGFKLVKEALDDLEFLHEE